MQLTPDRVVQACSKRTRSLGGHACSRDDRVWGADRLNLGTTSIDEELDPVDVTAVVRCQALVDIDGNAADRWFSDHEP